jgi:hypothetical protein
MRPRKVMFRLLSWMSGAFELEPPDEKAVLEELTESTEGLLMEGMRQLDEMRRIETEMPPRDAFLQIAQPLQPPLRELTPLDLDVFQLVLNNSQIQATIDRSPHTDLDTLTSLQALIAKEYVYIAAPE